MCEYVDVVHAVRLECGHCATGSCAEADHGSTKPSTVVACGADDLQGVQHGAVSGQFVVLVEHVQVEGAVGGPVVHRLERDQRQPPVDGLLGKLLILHTV